MVSKKVRNTVQPRALTEKEIENILDFIEPEERLPNDVAWSIYDVIIQDFEEQLYNIKIHPKAIPELKKEIIEQYFSSRIQPGECVGVICAQSCGQKQTQMTLNSVDWQEEILCAREGTVIVEHIGKIIDELLVKNPEKITHIERNRTEYLELSDGWKIPSCDEDGKTDWYKIEAVTRHLPVGDLVKVTTSSGRKVTATQAKSFLVWNGEKFVDKNGSDIKVGDILPTTKYLPSYKKSDVFDLETIFSKKEYIFTDEIVKLREYRKIDGQWREKNTGDNFTMSDMDNEFISCIPSKIPLDESFGFLLGIYLADGWVTKTFMGINNNDCDIREKVTKFCDKYSIAYHLVTTSDNRDTGDLKIHSVILARMFNILCGRDSHNKKVPTITYNTPNSFIIGLLDGYFSGDGTVSKKDGSVVATSTSEQLLNGINVLLSYFGIFSSMSNWQNDTRRTYCLRISNGYAQKFANIINLTEKNKQHILETITKIKTYSQEKTQENYPDRDVYFDSIVSIEYVKGTTEYVYDLTVEKTRNFQLFNGLNCRDTFHKAGASEKGMTSGVPRFKEINNATKVPKNRNCKIYFKNKISDIKELREITGHSLVGLKVKDIVLDSEVILKKEDEPWYKIHQLIYNKEKCTYTDCIKLQFDLYKLYQYKLTLTHIANSIEKEFSDLHCIPSPLEKGRMDVFVDTRNITLPEETLAYVNTDNQEEIYLEECVIPTLEQIYVCGIPGITNTYFIKENDDWIIETDCISGKNKLNSEEKKFFRKLLAHPNIDSTKTLCNDMWEIYDTLGIEATRLFLVDEINTIMEGINECHVNLLVDRLTYTGTITGISRYTLKKEESGPMGKASFEETMDNFLTAGAHGDIENTGGVSASIVCGKRTRVGTGMMDLKIDMDGLPCIMEEDEVMVEEDVLEIGYDSD